MAFSKLAETYSDLHYDDKAYQASRRAVDLSQGLPLQDRYRIEASNARIMNDNAKAIAAYENLTKLNPDDIDAQYRPWPAFTRRRAISTRPGNALPSYWQPIPRT